MDRAWWKESAVYQIYPRSFALPWTLAVTGAAVYLPLFLDPDGLWITLFLWFTAVIAVVAYLNTLLFTFRGLLYVSSGIKLFFQDYCVSP